VPTGFNTIPYLRQLDNNIGYGFGASLSIPIFNNYSARGNVEKAKLNAINDKILSDQTKQTLKTNIQNAIASAKAAKQSLAAAEAATTAAKIAHDNANRKSELGSLNNFELLSARNRYDTAQNNLLIARYEYYFRIKVIEYYLGRGIRLN
jgi:outer membrane protein